MSAEQDMQTDQPKDGLLPCPFCGSPAEAQWLHSSSGRVRCYYIGCSNDDCPCEVSASGQTEDEAIAAWNTRSPAHAGMKEALGHALAALEEAEAILGGEYGDHYAVLCERMINLRAALRTAAEGK